MSVPFVDDVALLASLVRDLQQSVGRFATELPLTGGVVRVLFMSDKKVKQEMVVKKGGDCGCKQTK